MKTIIISLICLLVGFGIGWHSNEKYITNEAVQATMQGIESSDGEEAARAVRAIELIASGDTQKAVRLLSTPIAIYYHLYAIDAGTNEERRIKMRAMIEQLVSTNKIVAEEITNQMENYKLPWKAK